MRQRLESQTSLGVAAFRALGSGGPPGRGGASDPVAARLLPAGLGPAVAALARAARGRAGAHRALGLVTLGLFDNVVLRTRRIDELLEGAAARGAAQIVLLGAGLDARAYRLQGLANALVFEVDHPATQAAKRRRLAGCAAVATAREVRFVAVDFERERLPDALEAAGFDATRPSAWVWEGVTMYLSEAARSSTLAALAALAAPGSEVLLTYMRPGDVGTPLRRAACAAAALVGEPIRGFVEAEQLAAELEARGFRVLEDEGAEAWARRYWVEAPVARTWEHLIRACKLPN
ncbi:MAG: SAM-dependent methyltransferase [Polyangiaceae bacterium]|jgi:methyltransferase (TIGR00027 family)|nr:SAM-dependent methyltransferase [Polyangiaceae bacterium]